MTIPPEIRTLHPNAQDAYIERVSILSEGGPITLWMDEVATKEARGVHAREIGKEMAGRVEKLKGTLLRPRKEVPAQGWMNLGNPEK